MSVQSAVPRNLSPIFGGTLDFKDDDDSRTPPPELSEPWSHTVTNYVKKVRAEMLHKHQLHEKCGEYFRIMEVRWGLPTMLIPGVLGPISLLTTSLTKEDCSKITYSDYITTFGFVLTTCVTGIYNFYQFGSRSTEHYVYAARYSEVISEIDVELSKKKQYRTSSAVFVTAMTMKNDNLVFGEPAIPSHIHISIPTAHPPFPVHTP